MEVWGLWLPPCRCNTALAPGQSCFFMEETRLAWCWTCNFSTFNTNVQFYSSVTVVVDHVKQQRRQASLLQCPTTALWTTVNLMTASLTIELVHVHNMIHDTTWLRGILSGITAGSPMVGTPINLVRGLIRLGLIKDLNLWPLLSVDLWNGWKWLIQHHTHTLIKLLPVIARL